MKQRNSRSFLAGLMAAIMVISGLTGIALAVSTGTSQDGQYTLTKMDEVTINTHKENSTEVSSNEEQMDYYSDDDEVALMIVLEDEPVLKSSGTLKSADAGRMLTDKGENLTAQLLSEQNIVANNIAKEVFDGQALDIRYNFTLAMNAFTFTTTYGNVEAIRNVPGVFKALIMPTYEVPKTSFKEAGDEIKPFMYSAGQMVYGPTAWDMGYDGSGILVAVIDSGFYTDHEAFKTAPENPKYTKEDIATILENNNLQAEKRLKGLTADDVFLREKVPFVFDYYANDTDVNHGHSTNSTDHGTHVAGITLADPQETMLDTDVYARGVAPKAQLAVMKVFSDAGGRTNGWDDIAAALEDCIYLGVDVANMSLGSTLGFPDQDPIYDVTYKILDEYGVAISAAAGNDYSAGVGNTWGTTTNYFDNMNTTENLDSSMLGSPSTYEDSLSIAAIFNDHIYRAHYLAVGETKMVYSDAAAASVNNKPELQIHEHFGGQELEYVVVPGLGDVSDYEGLDVQGKIALVQRGTINFEDKQLNAANAGAVAIVVYDNVVDVLTNMSIPNNFVIPAVFISLENGQIAVNSAVDGVGKMLISNQGAIDVNAAGYTPTSFSSWGPLSNLTIKPEIAAPGGNIMSTVDPLLTGNGEMYGEMSGTSMATPNVAGSLAIVRQYVNEKFPDLSLEEKVDMTYTLLMSTAYPTVNGQGTPYAVRKQGAGMVNLKSALSTKAYLIAPDLTRPKLEIGDDPSRSGVYTLKFSVKNFGDSTLSYTIDPVLTTANYKLVDQGVRSAYIMCDDNLNLSSMMTFTTNYENNVVSVGAGETKEIEVVMTLNQEARDMIAEVFPFGAYMEGYCYLRANADGEGALGTDLNICFLGFYGSWSEVPVVDAGFYYEGEAAKNSTAYPNTAASKYSRNVMYGLGVNPYVDADPADYLADRNSISPANEDGYYDEVDQVYTAVMRNLRKFYYNVFDDKGTLVWDKTFEGQIRKNWDTDPASADYINPMGVSGYSMGKWNFELNDGTTYTVRVGGVPYMDNFDESVAKRAYWEFPVTVDNEQPLATNCYVSGDKLYVVVSDNHYVAYVGLYSSKDAEEPVAYSAVYEKTRGASTTLEFNLSDIGEHAYMVVADYACNETQYEIKDGTLVQPMPEPPETDDTYYAPMNTFEVGETYIITADNSLMTSENVMSFALSSFAAQPFGVRLQGVAVNSFLDGHIVGGEKLQAIEWRYNEDGTLQSVQNGQYLGVVDFGESIWLGMTSDKNNTTWSYDGTYLHPDSAHLREAGHVDVSMIYFTTIANSDVPAFDIMPSEQGQTPVKLYKRVTQEKSAPVTLSAKLREESDAIFVDVDLNSNDVNVGNGFYTITYDPAFLSFAGDASCTRGDAMGAGDILICNGQVPGTVVVAISCITPLPPMQSGILTTIRLEKNNRTVMEGTVIAVDLTCNELMREDAMTLIATKTYGSYLVIGGGDLPNPPTTEPAPSNDPTNPPTTAPAPSDKPTDAPTTAPAPSDKPTDAPTTAPAPSDKPTDAPTTAPAPSDNPTNPPASDPATSAPATNPPATNPPQPTHTASPTPPGTGDSARTLMIISFVIMGLSALGYVYAKRREAQDAE